MIPWRVGCNFKTYLRYHRPEYLMEAAGMGLYLFFTCLFETLLQHPHSPIHCSGRNRGRYRVVALGQAVRLPHQSRHYVHRISSVYSTQFLSCSRRRSPGCLAGLFVSGTGVGRDLRKAYSLFVLAGKTIDVSGQLRQISSQLEQDDLASSRQAPSLE